MNPTNTASRHVALPAAAILLAAALVAGCTCTVGFREVHLEATVAWLDPARGSFGTFGFGISQFRGTHLPDSDSIGWGYEVEVEPESLAGVQIRQGPGPAGGRLLYDLTRWGHPPWVPSGLAPQRYPGPLRIEEFYTIMQAGDAHVEFTLQGGTGPVASGRLVVTRDAAWHDSPCD